MYLSAASETAEGLSFSNSRKPPKYRTGVSYRIRCSALREFKSNRIAPQEYAVLHPGDRRTGVWLDVRSSTLKNSRPARTGAGDTQYVRHLNALI
jgi:hypothetical protein